MSERLKALCVTGLGTGYLPVAPGTWGSALVAGIYWLVAWGSGGRQVCLSGTMAVVIGLSCFGCVSLGAFAERRFGEKDPGACTVDELAGQGVALLLLPLSGGPVEGDLLRWALGAGAAFLAFRAFDILKPPPARRLEKLPQGWGVLLDDIAAGVYAGVACQLILRLGLGMH